MSICRVMRRGRPVVLGFIAVVGFVGTCPGLRGQAPLTPFDTVSPAPSPTPTKKVRRAQPVVAPAEAVTPDDATDAATPTPTPRRKGPSVAPGHAYPKPGNDAPVDPTPSTDGQAAAVSPAPATVPASGDAGDSSGDIRIAPQMPGETQASPEDVQFNLANDFYKRGQYTQAAAEYERYLGQYPDGKQRQAALWWLGESYRNLKRTSAARSAYGNLAISFQEGDFVGPACFRLAVIDYDAKDYKTSLGFFQRSASLAKGEDVKLTSRYFEAICLEQLGRRDETREVYQDVLSFKNNNPYRDDAHLALANMAMADKHPNEAFKEYEALSREATKPALQAESALKAGLLARELEQNDTAYALLKHATELPGATAVVRSDAMIAQLHLLYDTNKYKQLLEEYPTMRPAMPELLQPEAMLLAANANRQIGKHADARATYDELIIDFPRSPQATEARYQKVISLYAADDASFVAEADAFLGLNTDPVKADQVRLMKADSLFKRKDYSGAAAAYATLDDSSSLPPKYRAEAMYRLGYCYAQSRSPERTISAFTRFLRRFADHPFAAKALMLRASAYQQLKNYSSALADFSEVVNDHKDAKERELAMQQKALILGQQGDARAMMDTFRALLKEYPKSDAVGMAHYSIANAAFENKDYPTALAEFDAARKTDAPEYGAKGSLMVLLCQYQLKDRQKLAAEIESYQKAKTQPAVPASILRWLGEQEYDAKEFAAADAHLTAATAALGSAPSDAWLLLAHARLNLGHDADALDASGHYLKGVGADPAAQANGLLAQAEAQVGLKQYDETQKSIDEIMQLQPEGMLNAKARMLEGKMNYAQGKYEAAAKSYMSVAVLYDDAEVTPQALQLAAEAFTKAGQADEATKASDELKSRFPDFKTANVP